jgi:hypothetical protein
MGYPRRLLLCLTLAVLFAGGLELLQMLVPGRHARLVDFARCTRSLDRKRSRLCLRRRYRARVLRIKKMQRSSGPQLTTVSEQAAPVRSLSSDLAARRAGLLNTYAEIRIEPDWLAVRFDVLQPPSGSRPVPMLPGLELLRYCAALQEGRLPTIAWRWARVLLRRKP